MISTVIAILFKVVSAYCPSITCPSALSPVMERIFTPTGCQLAIYPPSWNEGKIPPLKFGLHFALKYFSKAISFLGRRCRPLSCLFNCISAAVLCHGLTIFQDLEFSAIVCIHFSNNGPFILILLIISVDAQQILNLRPLFPLWFMP